MPSPSNPDRDEPPPSLADFDAALATAVVAAAIRDGLAWNASLRKPGEEPPRKSLRRTKNPKRPKPGSSS